MFKPQRSPWPYFLNWPCSLSKIFQTSMRGLAKVSLPLKWGLWKVACDAFPLCCAALDPDNDSWERWGGPAQLDPNESHEVIFVSTMPLTTDTHDTLLNSWDGSILLTCPSTEVHWISDLSQLAVSQHKYAQVWSSSWGCSRMLSFGGRQGIIIDYAMPKILGLSTLGPVKRGSLCHGRTWNPTYAHDLDCKKHMKRNMCIYIYIYLHPCVVRRDWKNQWICT